MKRPGKILGIALGPTGALFAEVAANGKRKVLRLAEFAYPAGLSVEHPVELGKAIGAFLKQEGIGERDAAIGLPAKWLVTRKKDLPPATAAVAAESLRLQAETEFSNERDLVVDYAGEASSAAPTSVLLVATAQNYVDNCVTLARAAGLRPRTITATGAALARATGVLPGAPDVLVSISSAGVELVVQHGGSATHLRHMSLNDLTDAAPLAGEIRRALVGLPQNGTLPGVSLWHRNGDSLGDALRERLSIPVTSQQLLSIATYERPGAAGDGRFAPAVAVAAAALEGPPVDFLHSRLAPPAPRSAKRLILWSIVAVVLVAGAIVARYVDLYLRSSDLARVKASVVQGKPGAERDRLGEERLKTARSFGTMSPRYTACFRDLTATFPDDGRIWGTSLKLAPEVQRDAKPDPKNPRPPEMIRGDLTFKTRELAAGDSVRLKIQQATRFYDVKINNITENPTTGDWAVSITFQYKPQ